MHLQQIRAHLYVNRIVNQNHNIAFLFLIFVLDILFTFFGNTFLWLQDVVVNLDIIRVYFESAKPNQNKYQTKGFNVYI